MDTSQQDIFLEAYDQYAEAIYRHCYFRVYSKQKAEDLTQETFMKAWIYISDGKQVDNIRAFLYRVAQNCIIDSVRKKKEESLDSLREDSRIAEPSYTIHRDVERDMLMQDIKKHMDALPDDYQRLLTLRYIDDLGPKEIAAVLKSNENAISVKLNRALKALKKEMIE